MYNSMQHPSGTATDYYGRTQGKGDQKSAYSPKKKKSKNYKQTNKKHQFKRIIHKRDFEK